METRNCTLQGLESETAETKKVPLDTGADKLYAFSEVQRTKSFDVHLSATGATHGVLCAAVMMMLLPLFYLRLFLVTRLRVQDKLQLSRGRGNPDQRRCCFRICILCRAHDIDINCATSNIDMTKGNRITTTPLFNTREKLPSACCYRVATYVCVYNKIVRPGADSRVLAAGPIAGAGFLSKQLQKVQPGVVVVAAGTCADVCVYGPRGNNNHHIPQQALLLSKLPISTSWQPAWFGQLCTLYASNLIITMECAQARRARPGSIKIP